MAWPSPRRVNTLPNFTRCRQQGGRYFFTVNLLERYPNDLLTQQIRLLRESVKHIKNKYPFEMDGWVVLPDHMHCIWTVPDGDDDFPKKVAIN
jgi:putative transposase